MKEALLLLILILLIAGLATLAVVFPEQQEKSNKELCLEKGGVPIMNWNNSYLKDCKFSQEELKKL